MSVPYCRLLLEDVRGRLRLPWASRCKSEIIKRRRSLSFLTASYVPIRKSQHFSPRRIPREAQRSNIRQNFFHQMMFAHKNVSIASDALSCSEKSGPYFVWSKSHWRSNQARVLDSTGTEEILLSQTVSGDWWFKPQRSPVTVPAERGKKNKNTETCEKCVQAGK